MNQITEANFARLLATLNNDAGAVSSAGALTLAASGAITNQGGVMETDAALTLTSASLDNGPKGLLNSRGALTLATGTRISSSFAHRAASTNLAAIRTASAITATWPSPMSPSARAWAHSGSAGSSDIVTSMPELRAP